VKSLEILYNSTHGSEWHWKENKTIYGKRWVFSSSNQEDPCINHWQGLTCSSDDTIVNISLSAYWMRGSLPSYLFLNFSSLISIDFSNNLIYGNLHASLGNLTKLQNLALESNHFYELLPALLTPMLRHLHLYNNALTGSIAHIFCQLTQIQYLDLGYNRFMGTLSTTIGKLSVLSYHTLLHNHLSGTIPSAFGLLPNLSHLQLRANRFIGTIPNSLGRISRLTYMHIGENCLSGTIPSELGKLSNIIYLSLLHCSLEGTIPASLIALTRLIELNFNVNCLTGTIPISL